MNEGEETDNPNITLLPELIEVTPADVALRDIQGIPWSRSVITREAFRLLRLADYEQAERFLRQPRPNITPPSMHEPWRNSIDVPAVLNDLFDETPYGFYRTNLLDSVGISHFQLRHLLSAPSVQTVCFPHAGRLKMWNPLRNESRVLVNLREDFSGSFTRPTCLCATSEWVAAGGFLGELVIYRHSDNAAGIHTISSSEEDPMINQLTLMNRSEGILASCNDHLVRWFDMQRVAVRDTFRLPWCVNASRASPDERLICAVGDDPEALFLDVRTGKVCLQASIGHTDFSFTVDWSKNGWHVATGNQDKTTRILDMRNASQPLAVFHSRMAAIRSVRFSGDSHFLAVMEADDYVHILDMTSPTFACAQTIDFFGEIGGIDFSPESGDSLFIGCADPTRGCLIEMRRRKANSLDCLYL